MKISVFDSEKGTISAIEKILRNSFHQIEIFSSGSEEQFYEYVKKESPDILVIVVDTPETGLLERIKKFRSDKSVKKIPALLVLQPGMENNQLKKLIPERIDTFIYKPLDELILTSQIRLLDKLRTQHFENPDEESYIPSDRKKQGKGRKKTDEEPISLASDQLKMIFNNIPEILLISKLADGTIIYANERIESIAGYKKEEIIGKSTINLKMWEDINDRNRYIKQLGRGGKVVDMEIDFRKCNGEIFTGLISGDMFTLNEEQVVLSVVKDISERKKVEQILYEKEEKYRSIHEDASVGLYRTSLEGKYLSVNPALVRIMGYSTADEMIKTINDVGKQQYVNPADRILFIDSLKKKDRIENYEVQIYRKDRKKIWLSINAHFVRDVDNNVKYIEGSMLDITAQKAAQAELKKSEEKYRILVETMKDGIYRSTPDGRFVDFNPALITMLGYENREELMAVDIKTGLYFDESDRESSVLEENLEEQAIYPLKKKDGSKIWVEDHGWLVKDNKGNTLFHEGILRDVTERKVMEEQLKRSEELYRTLSNASPEANVMFDGNGEILEVSDITPGMLNYSKKSDLIGKSFLQFISPQEVEIVKSMIRETKNDGKVKNFEVQIIRRDQTTFAADVSLASVQKNDEKKRIYLVIFRDVTEKKNMELQFVQNARLVSLGEMATSIAHEINQPLHIISMTLDNIIGEVKSKKPVDETYIQNKSDKIFNNIERIRHIIDHVRAFSRDHTDYESSLFDIHESITNAVSMISEQFKHKAIKLTIEKDESINPLLGNVFKFEQVILNLLGNAKDAVEERKEITLIPYNMEIGIRTYIRDKSVIIEIKDNGIGILAEDIEKVMMPFYTTKIIGKGTGLGLAISHRIIQEMNGKVEIDSKRYEGTNFRIVLPVVENKE